MEKRVEILSPAGSYESLKAAIVAGADAVYVGGSRFGARAYANNLSEEQLLEAIDYVHLHGRRIYLTINTLIKEKEMKQELYNYLLPYYRQGLDAVIVQDMGVLAFVKEHFPDLPIHASTQMTITNVMGASFLKQQGVERVVTSRELKIDEVREIAEKTGLEIESFVHGALCYCYSGQCLYSSLIGGRSGNRGQCAQPCRLPYKVNGSKQTQYVLSLKDICTLESIPELVEAGIYSFKIEGRMKKPEYVALVTAMYRKYVDLYLQRGKNGFSVDPKDREALMDLYNRGGSHDGYYHMRNGREMVSLTRPNHAGVEALQIVKQNGKSLTAKALVELREGDVIEMADGQENYTLAKTVKRGQNLTLTTHKRQAIRENMILNRTRNEQLIQRIRQEIVGKKIKERIHGKLILSTTEPAKLMLRCAEVEVEVIGEVAQEAINQPMDAARIEKQMRKTGNTEFEFDTLEIVLEGKVFVPLQSLNELRRQGLEALEDSMLNAYRRREGVRPAYRVCEEKLERVDGLYVSVETLEQFHAVVQTDGVRRIYLDCSAVERIWESAEVASVSAKARAKGKELYLIMPYIFRKDSVARYEKHYDNLFGDAWDGVLVRNYESYQFLRQHCYSGKIVTDYNLYQFNTYAKDFWQKEQVDGMTAPLELNYGELSEVGIGQSELLVYGYLPMMVSAQCVVHTTKGCRHKKERTVLKDRYHKEFTVKNLCDDCYNIVYNTAPLALWDQKYEIDRLHPKALRLSFTIEDASEVKKVLELYEAVFLNGEEVQEPEFEFTKGHFKRGIK